MGVTNFDVVQANVLIGAGLVTQGNVWHVKPGTGSDGNSGRTPTEALKTLAKAQSLATANQNDVVLLYAQSNSASATTDYQSATLDWAKDLVHLIGVGANSPFSNRARIAQLSTARGLTSLMTLSADGCLIKNVSIFQGVNDANSLVALKVTGTRNVIEDCHIAGIGHATQVTAGAASLSLDGATENLIRHCTIGLDTVARTTAGHELILDTSASKSIFEDCMFVAFISNVGYEHVSVVDSTGAAGTTLFKNCLFHSRSVNKATPQNQIFDLPSSLGSGLDSAQLILMNSYYSTDDGSCVWVTAGKGILMNNSVAAAASGAGGGMTIL